MAGGVRGSGVPSWEWDFVYFIIHITMDSREVDLSGSVSSDMVPPSEIYRVGCNKEVKAVSDVQVPSPRFRQSATQGSNHLVKKGRGMWLWGAHASLVEQ